MRNRYKVGLLYLWNKLRRLSDELFVQMKEGVRLVRLLNGVQINIDSNTKNLVKYIGRMIPWASIVSKIGKIHEITFDWRAAGARLLHWLDSHTVAAATPASSRERKKCPPPTINWIKTLDFHSLSFCARFSPCHATKTGNSNPGPSSTIFGCSYTKVHTMYSDPAWCSFLNP